MFTQNPLQFKSQTYPEWDEIFTNWHTKKSVGYHFILDKILETIGSPKGKSFIDVGCGYGYLTFALADMGANAVCLDVRKDRIQTINDIKKKYQYGNNPWVIQAELKKWYAESKHKFDYTLWMNVMHHIGLFDSREDAFNILGKMLDNSKGVFLMVRPYWTRTAGTWDIGRSFKESQVTLMRETGATLIDLGSVPYWQAGRPLYYLEK